MRAWPGSMTARTFPKPWRAVRHEESYGVEDANGFHLAFVYFDDIQERATIRGRMSSDEARRIASNIAKLPELLELAKRVGLGDGMGEA